MYRRPDCPEITTLLSGEHGHMHHGKTEDFLAKILGFGSQPQL